MESIENFMNYVYSLELKNHLRSGDLWVKGSRQYKDFLRLSYSCKEIY